MVSMDVKKVLKWCKEFTVFGIKFTINEVAGDGRECWGEHVWRSLGLSDALSILIPEVFRNRQCWRKTTNSNELILSKNFYADEKDIFLDSIVRSYEIWAFHFMPESK